MNGSSALRLLVLALVASPAGAVGETHVFAPVPAPGFAEGIAVLKDTVFVGTGYGAVPNAGQEASKIFLFDRDTGVLLRQIVVTGQDLTQPHGLTGLAFDGNGRLYAGSDGGVLRFTSVHGVWSQQVYATLPDLAPCAISAPPCSPTVSDRAPLANDLVFDRAGNLYVTDSWQATIFRIPPGGGAAEVWFQNGDFDLLFGMNGIRISPDGSRVFFSVTGPDNVAVGEVGRPSGIFSVPLVDRPQQTDLALFHRLVAPEAPDGIGFGTSGKLYVSSIGSNTIFVLNPDGSEATRFPDPVANAVDPTPYDFPATFAFVDQRRSILITNHVYFTGLLLRDHNTVLEAFVDDTGAPLNRPKLP